MQASRTTTGVGLPLRMVDTARVPPTASTSPIWRTAGQRPWPCACTGSPTPPTPGGTCSPAWPRPATTRWPLSAWLRPTRCRRTAATTPGTWPSTPAGCTRRWGDRGRGAHRARLGRLRHLRAAALEPERWRKVVTAAVAPGVDGRRVLQGSISCTGAGTCSSSRPPWPSTPCGWRTTLHRPAVGRLVTRLRRLVGYGQGQGALAPPKPERRHRVLPGHVLRASRRPADRRGAGRGWAVSPQPTLYLHGADDGCMASRPSGR